ncbi:hypothetical protein D3C75_648040 [compost metagenome]
MAEIVVRPNQCNIIGQIQSLVIQREYFFVRDKGLHRRFPFFLSQHIYKKLPLIPDDLAQKPDLCFLLFFFT